MNMLIIVPIHPSNDSACFIFRNENLKYTTKDGTETYHRNGIQKGRMIFICKKEKLFAARTQIKSKKSISFVYSLKSYQ